MTVSSQLKSPPQFSQVRSSMPIHVIFGIAENSSFGMEIASIIFSFMMIHRFLWDVLLLHDMQKNRIACKRRK